jgi:hypothetical protein
MTITPKGRAAIIQKDFGLTPTVTKAIEQAIIEHAIATLEAAEAAVMKVILEGVECDAVSKH